MKIILKNKKGLIVVVRTHNRNRFHAQEQNVDIAYVKEIWEQSSVDDVYTPEPLKSEKKHEHTESKQSTGRRTGISSEHIIVGIVSVPWLITWLRTGNCKPRETSLKRAWSTCTFLSSWAQIGRSITKYLQNGGWMNHLLKREINVQTFAAEDQWLLTLSKTCIYFELPEVIVFYCQKLRYTGGNEREKSCWNQGLRAWRGGHFKRVLKPICGNA